MIVPKGEPRGAKPAARELIRETIAFGGLAGNVVELNTRVKVRWPGLDHDTLAVEGEESTWVALTPVLDGAEERQTVTGVAGLEDKDTVTTSVAFGRREVIMAKAEELVEVRQFSDIREETVDFDDKRGVEGGENGAFVTNAMAVNVAGKADQNTNVIQAGMGLVDAD